MRKLLRGAALMLGAVLVLLAVAVALPFLFPLDRFIPELTRIASEKLGQPVSMAQLRLQMLPTPRAIATGIVVGKRQEVRVGEVEIVPELMSLLAGPKAVRVRAENIQLKEAALALPGKLPKSAPGGEEIIVRRVELRKVKLQHSAMKVPEFDLRAALGAGFALESARLETRDNSLRVILEPQGKVSRLKVEATNWTLPAGYPIKFEWLAGEGTLKGESVDMPKVEGRMYGGKLAASLRADWAKGYVVSGKAALSGVDVIPLQKAIGQKPQVSGKLNNEVTFNSRGRTPEQLQNALAADGPFALVGGAYHGYDLTQLGLKKLEQGGATTFDELKGNAQVRGQEIKVTDLCVRSPQFTAAGNVTIAPDDKLSGRLDVSLNKTGGFVGIPVSLGGTTADPSFAPTKGYVIGAAIGTVLLPGIGTSIGSSIGSRAGGKSECK